MKTMCAKHNANVFCIPTATALFSCALEIRRDSETNTWYITMQSQCSKQAFHKRSFGKFSFLEMPAGSLYIMHTVNPRPVALGSDEQRAPLGGAFWPPEISRTTQRSDKRQTALDSPWRELSKACKFFENRGHRAGQTEVKGQILLFLQWRLLRPNKAL